MHKFVNHHYKYISSSNQVLALRTFNEQSDQKFNIYYSDLEMASPSSIRSELGYWGLKSEYTKLVEKEYREPAAELGEKYAKLVNKIEFTVARCKTCYAYFIQVFYAFKEKNPPPSNICTGCAKFTLASISSYFPSVGFPDDFTSTLVKDQVPIFEDEIKWKLFLYILSNIRAPVKTIFNVIGKNTKANNDRCTQCALFFQQFLYHAKKTTNSELSLVSSPSPFIGVETRTSGKEIDIDKRILTKYNLWDGYKSSVWCGECLKKWFTSYKKLVISRHLAKSIVTSETQSSMSNHLKLVSSKFRPLIRKLNAYVKRLLVTLIGASKHYHLVTKIDASLKKAGPEKDILKICGITQDNYQLIKILKKFNEFVI